MKKRFAVVIAILLVLFVVSGCKKSGTAAESGGTGAGTASGKAWENIPTGYYNLADFESRLGGKIAAFKDPPSLASKVSSGELPPVEQRLPDNPAVFRTLDHIGEYGGTMRITSINIDQDWHLRHLNAGNLIEMPANSAWDQVSTVFGVDKQPGILESFGMSADGKVFTATIRKGIKWSDGAPVTTKDVAFKINDVLMFKEISPAAPTWMTWGGKETVFTITDDYTFSFTFGEPYGAFIEAEVTLWPGTFQRLLLPAHYLEKYHKSYNTEAAILEYMKADGYTNFNEWKEWFNTRTKLFECDNNYMDQGHTFPTLNPWVMAADLGNNTYRLDRNPYFYMVDQEGNQLPYIDHISRSFSSDEQVDMMSIISGQVDVSCMSLSLEDYPLLKENEDRGNFYALPLPAYIDQLYVTGFNAGAGIKPPTISSLGNVVSSGTDAPDSAYDPELAAIYSDVRFRRAMSVALNRQVFNDTIFLGLGRPAQTAPRPGSPYYKDGMEEAYASYDPEQAKKWLDEMGLKDVNGDGFREKPSGKPFTIKFEYFVISGASTPGAELCKRFWEEVGVRTDVRIVDTNYWWSNLQPNNLNEVTTWWFPGTNADLLQQWFVGPSMLNPLWNRYTTYKTSGISRDEWENKVLPYVPEWQREIQDLKLQLKSEPDPQKRIEMGTKVWELQAEYLPMIGVVTDTPDPMVISKDIGNVEKVEDMNLNYISVMENSECFYFKNPARRSN
jgi:peptide/nickel transport system substrate-binding protein